MKNIIIILSVFSVFLWISVVSASNYPVKESPESIVTCLNAEGDHLLVSRSVPGTINLEQCKVWPADIDQCSLCITSLEGQGCKIVEVGVTNPSDGGVAVAYFLSCDGL